MHKDLVDMTHEDLYWAEKPRKHKPRKPERKSKWSIYDLEKKSRKELTNEQRDRY